MPLYQAISIAEQVGLDVVEVSPNSSPPVCRLMDFGKYKYQLKKKSKDSKKGQTVIKTKEIKLRPTTDEHDVKVKVDRIKNFLKDGYRIKIGIFLKGREMMYSERAFKMLNNIIGVLSEEAMVSEMPKQMGKSIFAIVSPKR